jgi:hypothetical protein
VVLCAWCEGRCLLHLVGLDFITLPTYSVYCREKDVLLPGRLNPGILNMENVCEFFFCILGYKDQRLDITKPATESPKFIVKTQCRDTTHQKVLRFTVYCIHLQGSLFRAGMSRNIFSRKQVHFSNYYCICQCR